MNALFADTFYFLALLNKSDQAHQGALQFAHLATRLVTTSWVLTETADALSLPKNRPAFLQLLNALENSEDATIIGPEPELFAAGIELFRARPDKEWSLTDCISFAVMSDLNLTEALTGDQHFEQAGFKALLK